ncbi:MAG: hypothetical protein AAB955_01020 [Patescibacteria group bacterium]
MISFLIKRFVLKPLGLYKEPVDDEEDKSWLQQIGFYNKNNKPK